METLKNTLKAAVVTALLAFVSTVQAQDTAKANQPIETSSLDAHLLVYPSGLKISIKNPPNSLDFRITVLQNPKSEKVEMAVSENKSNVNRLYQIATRQTEAFLFNMGNIDEGSYLLSIKAGTNTQEYTINTALKTAYSLTLQNKHQVKDNVDPLLVMKTNE